MGSLRERDAKQRLGQQVGHPVGCALLALALSSCSVGHGTGEISGTVSIPGCRPESDYELRPTSFLAEATEQVLELRVQRGSDTEMLSDGVSLLVDDAAVVKRMLLNMDIPVAVDADPRLDLSLYLNETCPAERDKTPVALSAVSGTVRFSHIYAPRVSKNQVRIAAELIDVRFEDPRNDQRTALLNGSFDFLYVRGSPAQRFP
ncbi:MAG: hypothetical protein JWN48_1533 [Myxococcaceae bacterium]|nr:hypothetical protein [Myxococcaceae bacterium]